MFSFGQFVLDPVARSLRKGAERLHVSGKPLEVLILLVKENGSVIPRDRLRREIWQSVNVTDGTIDQAVRRVRSVLGDTADEPVFIETVSGEGHRFIAPVTEVRESSPASKTRRGWLGLALAGLVGVVLGLCRVFRGGRRLATAWRVDENTLWILDQDGKDLWHHTFPEPFLPEFYANQVKPCVFADLDGDGALETVFLYRAVQSTSLLCFDSKGAIRWRFTSQEWVGDFHSHDWGPPWILDCFAVVTGTQQPVRVIVSSHHHWSFPEHVAVLDARGKLVERYWHRGHLYHMAVSEFGDGGRVKVMLGGVNDAPEHSCATLLVFDAMALSGGSSDPHGEPYFRDLEAGTEEVEIFFPKTVLAKHDEFNQVSSMLWDSGRIMVIVTEGILTRNPNIVAYEFDSNFNVLSAALGDYAMGRYRDLEARGEIPMNSHVGEGERLRSEVRINRKEKRIGVGPRLN